MKPLIDMKAYAKWRKKNPIDPRIEDIEHFGVEYQGKF